MKYCVLFNPFSCNGKGLYNAKAIEKIVKSEYSEKHEFEYVNITDIDNKKEFINAIPKDVTVVLAGGDGTLNYFINNIEIKKLNKSIYYFPAGSGNDFWNDVIGNKKKSLLCIDRYLLDLPKVYVKGKEYYFINNVGFGIDGYCCEEADRIKAKSDKKVNYTLIALKGVIKDFKPVNARVTVDGVTKCYKRVWLAPSMKGRFYGGGMMATPNQNRIDKEGRVSVLVGHNLSKLRLLCIFPKIYKGNHIKNTDVVSIITGKHVIVEFDRPTALQIDGETIVGVTKYEVTAG